MKNIIIMTAFVLTLAGTMPLSCARNVTRSAAQEASLDGDAIKISTGGVAMEAIPAKYKTAPESITIRIHNGSQDTIQFGADYSIEKFSNDEWVKVELGPIAVIMIMYVLGPEESHDYKIGLLPEKADYTNGLYRVRKRILVGDAWAGITAEFEIGNII